MKRITVVSVCAVFVFLIILQAGTAAQNEKVNRVNPNLSSQIHMGEKDDRSDVRISAIGTIEDDPPFGSFDLPLDGDTVSGVITLMGWAADDNSGFEIYQDGDYEGSIKLPLGNAYIVEGMRPDIEQAYPPPAYYSSGWQLILATIFFPDGGNGTFKLYGKCTDAAGQSDTLGVKTLICDNANATKPFGTLEAPLPGGTAFGTDYRIEGWVLAPWPNIIPIDGSTIDVYIDGVNVGHPVYNIYEPYIAFYLPGYRNSEGAWGYFEFNTELYEDGTHTVAWVVQDSAGNTDSIGSRYFQIQNSPRIKVSGNQHYIASGDTIPSVTDGTYFGEVDSESDTSITRYFTITNTGAADLELGNINLTVTIVGLEELEEHLPLNIIHTNEVDSFGVIFHPNEAGEVTGMVTIESNDPKTPLYTYQLQHLKRGQTTTFPVIYIRVNSTEVPDSSTYDFGEIHIDSSKTARFVIENRGNADLEIDHIDSGYAFARLNPLTSSIVAPGDSASFEIELDLSGDGPEPVPQPGTHQFTCRIWNNDPDRNPYVIYFEFTVVSETDVSTIGNRPQSYVLYPNYPNPFNPVTAIRYALPQDGLVQICVFDLLGKRVTTLVDREQKTGFHATTWDARNDQGQQVSSGVYFYQMKAGTCSQIRKCILIR